MRVSVGVFAMLFSVVGLGCGGGSTMSGSPRDVGIESVETTLTTDGESAIDDEEGVPGKLGDWSRFRGPSADGASSATGLPLTWSDEENLVWKSPLPGAGASSPVVWNDRVYLTAYSGYFVPGQPDGEIEELKRHLLAFDLSSGEQLWKADVPAKLPEESTIRDHGYAANTPVVDADAIYVFFGKTGVFAFGHDGKAKWQTSVGDQTHGWGTSASPVLYEDLVIINASVESESLVALDRKSGDRKWSASGIDEAWNTPIVATSAEGRHELIVATHGQIKAFDPNTGDPLWNCATDITWYMVPSPVVIGDVIYYLGGRSGVASLAVRLGGSGDVTSSHRIWTSNKGSNVSSPVAKDGHLYYMNDQRGTAFCVNAETGDVVYEERLDRAGQVYSSALLAEGRVYYLTRDGKTFVLKAQPQFEELTTNDLRDGGQFNGSFAVTGNRLLVRSDKFLYCLGNSRDDEQGGIPGPQPE